jgi:selenocysteine lyase/cysteine desulfurase
VDGASGSQVHQSVIDAMTAQMTFGAANIGGYSQTYKRIIFQNTHAKRRKALSDHNTKTLRTFFLLCQRCPISLISLGISLRVRK